MYHILKMEIKISESSKFEDNFFFSFLQES